MNQIELKDGLKKIAENNRIRSKAKQMHLLLKEELEYLKIWSAMTAIPEIHRIHMRERIEFINLTIN